MSQQTQNDHYKDEADLAMALAVAVNEEIKDLFAAGADIVQIDEPYLQARAEKARRFALPAINRALEGIPGPTALHTCFGYAHIVHDRPNGYPFLAELAGAAADQISMESAQQKVDLSVLESLRGKTLIVGVIDLGDDIPVADDDPYQRCHRQPEKNCEREGEDEVDRSSVWLQAGDQKDEHEQACQPYVDRQGDYEHDAQTWRRLRKGGSCRIAARRRHRVRGRRQRACGPRHGGHTRAWHPADTVPPEQAVGRELWWRRLLHQGADKY